MKEEKYYLTVTMQTGERKEEHKPIIITKTNYSGKWYKTKKEVAEKIKQIKKMI